MDTLRQDLRFAIRSLRKSPGLVAVATLSLALGIAVNVTIFAGVDILLFRAIPYPDAGRLIHLWSNRPSQGWTQASVSLPDFFDWREQSRTAELVGYHVTRFNLADAERPERITPMQVSHDFFRIMGATVALGRGFTAQDASVAPDRVVALTDRFWRRRFRGDPG